MKLEAWLHKENRSREHFAAEIGRSVSSLSRYISGEMVPRKSVLKVISRVTGGQVTANDFSSEAEAIGSEDTASTVRETQIHAPVGGVPDISTPTINISSLGDGRFAINVAGAVSWEDALAISEIVRKYQQGARL